MSSRRRLALLAVHRSCAVALLLAWKGDKVVDRILDMRYGGVAAAQPDFPKPRDLAEANRQDLDYLGGFPQVDRSFSDARASSSRAASRASRKGGLARLAASSSWECAKALAAADNPHTNVERALLARLPQQRARALRDGSTKGSCARARAQRASRTCWARACCDRRHGPGAPACATPRVTSAARPSRACVEPPGARVAPRACTSCYPRGARDRLDRIVLSLATASTRGQSSRPIEPARARPPWCGPGGSFHRRPDFAEKAGESGKGVLEGHSRVAGHPAQRCRRASSRPTALVRTRRSATTCSVHAPLVHPQHDDRALLGDQISGRVEGKGALAPHRDLDLRFDTGGDYRSLRRDQGSCRRGSRPTERSSSITGQHDVLRLDHHRRAGEALRGLARRHRGRASARPAGVLGRGRGVQLPNSKIEIPISTGMHDWARGCSDPCAAASGPTSGTAPSAWATSSPTFRVAWRFEDYRRGIDTVLERALQAGGLRTESLAATRTPRALPHAARRRRPSRRPRIELENLGARCPVILPSTRHPVYATIASACPRRCPAPRPRDRPAAAAGSRGRWARRSRVRRHLDHVHAFARLDVRVLVGHDEELAAAGAHFLHVRLHFSSSAPRGAIAMTGMSGPPARAARA
jgi:hypothetical protein